MNNGNENITIYENIKDRFILVVSDIIISFNKKNKKPINIEINRILKKFSFRLNFPE